MDFNEIDQRVTRGLFRPLETIAAHVPTVEGVNTGLAYLDRLTGGLRPGKLNFVAGYSHHGKTSLMLRTAVHNLDADEDFTAVIISGDDTDDMILTKIIAFREHMSNEDVEQKSASWRIGYVQAEFKDRLLIATPQVNDAYSVGDCFHIYNEACNQFGVFPTYAVFDYLALLKTTENGSAMDIRNKARQLKALIRANQNTVWVVGTQCVKAAEEAPVLTLNHMEYGGHQDSDGVIIGCHRKSQAKMTEIQLREEEECPRVNISVMKNKITGRKSANPAGIVYAIDKVSGNIRELLDSDKPASHQIGGQVINFKMPSRKMTASGNQ